MSELAAADRIWNLLPAIYRTRDVESGGALRGLVEVLASQLAVVEEELDQFYDDQFIETAAEWATGYIGELIGYRPLSDTGRAVSARAEIADTISFRRRKGTASMLEDLAREVTGWPARVIEYYERIASTQYTNHVRPAAAASVSVAGTDPIPVGSMNGAFDDRAHTVDVRRVDAPRPLRAGRYNVPDIGIVLWRIAAQPLERTPLVPLGDGRRFRIDPLGTDSRLFSLPRPDSARTGLTQPLDVPVPLTVLFAAANAAQLYGRQRSLELGLLHPDGSTDAVPAGTVRFCDLADSVAGWQHEPPAASVAIDPQLGRVWFGTGVAPAAGDTPVAWAHLGAALPVGARGVASDAAMPAPVDRISGGGAIQIAIDAVAAGGTVQLVDSAVYAAPTIATASAPGAPAVVALRADDDARPLITAPSGLTIAPDAGGTVELDGLLVSGAVVLDEVGDERVRTVVLRDCTLVPGQRRAPDGTPVTPDRASLIVLDPFAIVRLERCVLGPIVAVDQSSVTLVDCVVDASTTDGTAFSGRAPVAGGRHVTTVADQVAGDGADAGGALDATATTVIGGIHASDLALSDCIVLATLPAVHPAVRHAAVQSTHRQDGCIRFSWLPVDSRVGRRFHCQPDPVSSAAPQPVFTSLRFGDPAYCQLTATTDPLIREGSDDGSEMGAGHSIFAPQREQDLRIRLDEYLRYGLEAGIIYAD